MKLKEFKREADFALHIRNELKKCNAQIFAIVGFQMQQAAWPDLHISHPYYCGFVEFKNHDTILRHDQKVQIRLLIEAGDNAYVVRAPNKIEDEKGNLLGQFDQTGISLLTCLKDIVKNYEYS
jgi:hypothetical protein